MPDQLVRFEGRGCALPPVKAYSMGHNDHVILENNLVIDKETLQPVVKETERDLDKEIESYKDECGMEFVLRQIAAGRLSIDQIRDDGKSGQDITGVPETINEASMMKEAAIEYGLKEAAKLGLKTFSEKELNDYIQNELKKAQAKAAEAKSEGGESK